MVSTTSIHMLIVIAMTFLITISSSSIDEHRLAFEYRPLHLPMHISFDSLISTRTPQEQVYHAFMLTYSNDDVNNLLDDHTCDRLEWLNNGLKKPLYVSLQLNEKHPSFIRNVQCIRISNPRESSQDTPFLIIQSHALDINTARNIDILNLHSISNPIVMRFNRSHHRHRRVWRRLQTHLIKSLPRAEEHLTALLEMDASTMTETQHFLQLWAQLQHANAHEIRSQFIWELIVRPLLNVLKKFIEINLSQTLSNMLNYFLTFVLGSFLTKMAEIGPSPLLGNPFNWTQRIQTGAQAMEHMRFSSVPTSNTSSSKNDAAIHSIVIDGLNNDSRTLLEADSEQRAKLIVGPIVSMLVPAVKSGLSQSLETTLDSLLQHIVALKLSDQLHDQLNRTISRSATWMLTISLTESISHAAVDTIAKLMVRPMSMKITKAITAYLTRVLTSSLTQTLVLSWTRNPADDLFCQFCEDGTQLMSAREAYCKACKHSKQREYFTSYTAEYFARYYGMYMSEQYHQLSSSIAQPYVD